MTSIQFQSGSALTLWYARLVHVLRVFDGSDHVIENYLRDSMMVTARPSFEFAEVESRQALEKQLQAASLDGFGLAVLAIWLTCIPRMC